MKRADKKKRAVKKKADIIARMTDIFADVFENTKANALGVVDMKPGVRAVEKYVTLLKKKRPQENALIREACSEWEKAMVEVVKKLAEGEKSEEKN